MSQSTVPGNRVSLKRIEWSSLLEVFQAFLKLGLTSFGGPIAHLGYFRTEFVVRRQWVDETGYANLVALCQFLPGPASSQVGFSLGVLRANGLLGGMAAWLAFTLPTAVILFGFAMTAALFDSPIAAGAIHGLKLVAVAVIAQALVGMIRTLTPDGVRVGIALAAAALALTVGGSTAQIGSIVLGAIAGLLFCASKENLDRESSDYGVDFPVSKHRGAFALAMFAVLLAGPPLLLQVESSYQPIALFNACYQAGALVFGGGHVVLPLLEAQVVAPGWLDNETFLAGYGLAQAMPGPLFAIAAYLGALVQPAPSGAIGASIALVAIFLPGLLLVYGMLPFWNQLRMHPSSQAAMRGANAAVVGILGAALYSPAWSGAVFALIDVALVLAGFLLLTIAKFPSWAVVLMLASAGALTNTN